MLQHPFWFVLICTDTSDCVFSESFEIDIILDIISSFECLFERSFYHKRKVQYKF